MHMPSVTNGFNCLVLLFSFPFFFLPAFFEVYLWKISTSNTPTYVYLPKFIWMILEEKGKRVKKEKDGFQIRDIAERENGDGN